MSALLKIVPATSLVGAVRPPSDKSLTHRAYMLGAIAGGVSVVRTPLRGEDCENTLKCLKRMGLVVTEDADGARKLNPAPVWVQPPTDLDCGNSGTTVRLLSGLVASRKLDCVFVGDESLSRRPMKRVAEPLRLMGAQVFGDQLPMRVTGADLKGISYDTPVASAQIKSCILLAGLRAEGETWVFEAEQSRDHTERMLRACGVELLQGGKGIGVAGGAKLQPFQFSVPADISSAAFSIVAAALVQGSNVDLHQVGVNPTRTGILDVLHQAEADFQVENLPDELGEPVANISVKYTQGLKAFRIGGALVPRLIDEIPVLAVLATQCEGVTKIHDAKELRVKESDRIELVAKYLRAMGAKVETQDDGMEIEGPTPLQGTYVEAHGDHRIAMAFAVAALIAEGETFIEGAESIATSYPDFENDLRRLQS